MEQKPLAVDSVITDWIIGATRQGYMWALLDT
jgi:hypothetical protein